MTNEIFEAIDNKDYNTIKNFLFTNKYNLNTKGKLGSKFVGKTVFSYLKTNANELLSKLMVEAVAKRFLHVLYNAISCLNYEAVFKCVVNNTHQNDEVFYELHTPEYLDKSPAEAKVFRLFASENKNTKLDEIVTNLEKIVENNKPNNFTVSK